MTDLAFKLLGPQAHWTLDQVLRRQARRYGERPFMRFAGGDELTFAGYDTRADQVARALAAHGVGAGDRVFVMLRNQVELVLLAMAAGRAGAVFVPINTELKGLSLQHQLHNSAPRLVVVAADLLSQFDGVSAPAAALSAVVVAGGDDALALPAAFGAVAPLGWQDFEAAGRDATRPIATPQPHEVGCIMYTSGTTGPAKGVLMPHAHLALFSVPLAAMTVSDEDVYYVCMPLFHVNALCLQVFASLLCGAQVYCVERFSPSRWLDDVRQSGATLTSLLGIMTELLFKTPVRADDADNRLRAMLAVPVASWIGDFAARFGVLVLQGFAMTECNLVAATTADDPLVPGCCGTVRDELFEVKIVDSLTDQPVPDGEIGEIVVRPRLASAFMQGYFDMPGQTVEAWRNLWFHTGDAGRLEGGRRLYYADRIKDRIRRRGENVSAFEVEQAIGLLPGVAESAVVGITVGDQGAEQEIKACIVLAPGAQLTAVQVLTHCIATVPRFAVPRFIEFLDALPRTASNKLQKHLLRASGAGAGCWDRETQGHSARNHKPSSPSKGSST